MQSTKFTYLCQLSEETAAILIHTSHQLPFTQSVESRVSDYGTLMCFAKVQNVKISFTLALQAVNGFSM